MGAQVSASRARAASFGDSPPAIAPAALPRDLSGSPLHRLVREHLSTFLARSEDEHGGRRLPPHVEDEFRALLRCGDPTFGFCRIQCRSCQADLLVPFSCKGRAFCPTCGGRRMNELAAHLVEGVLPSVPVRQWVFSLPWHLRFALAGDPNLQSKVACAFLRAVSAFYCRRARADLESEAESEATAHLPPPAGPARLVPGAVNFVQRFGSSLGLNVHFHAIFLDGVHRSSVPTGPPPFLPASELLPDKVRHVHWDAIRRIHRVLRSAGCADLVRAGAGDCDAAARRRTWAELLERVFAEDVLRFPRCGGRRHHVAATAHH